MIITSIEILLLFLYIISLFFAPRFQLEKEAATAGKRIVAEMISTVAKSRFINGVIINVDGGLGAGYNVRQKHCCY